MKIYQGQGRGCKTRQKTTCIIQIYTMFSLWYNNINNEIYHRKFLELSSYVCMKFYKDRMGRFMCIYRHSYVDISLYRNLYIRKNKW